MNGNKFKLGTKVKTGNKGFYKDGQICWKNTGKIVNIIVHEVEYVVEMESGQFARVSESELYKHN